MASRDLGALGPTEGPPFTYPWRRVYSAIPAVPWLFLLALLCLKPNRKPGAWLIWIPCLIVAAVVASAREIPFIGSRAPLPLTWVGIGLGCLWLVAYRLSALEGFRRFVNAVGILWLVGALTIVCDAGIIIAGKMAGQVVSGGLTYVVLSLVTAIALALAIRLSRRQGSTFLLAAIFMVSLTGLSAVPALLLALFAMASQGAMIFSIVLFAASVGLAYSLLLMPFLLLAFWAPLYRERLLAVWQPTQPETVTPPPFVDPPEDVSNPPEEGS